MCGDFILELISNSMRNLGWISDKKIKEKEKWIAEKAL
jgi:hypothetical protein